MAPTTTEACAAAPEAPEALSGTTQLLRFTLGSERCAIRIESVREILGVPRTTALPLTPGFVQGVMNLRGAVVPVIDLGLRLGLGPAVRSRTSCVVVVDVCGLEGESGQRLGMLVDAVHEVFDVPLSSFEPVPRLGTRINPEFIRGMTRARGQTVADINLDAAFEHESLARLVAVHHLAH